MITEPVTAVLADLISNNSVNPAYPGGVGEAEVASVVHHRCTKLGLDVVRQQVLPGRDNVLATLTVPQAQETLVYEAHMDTVALDQMGEEGLHPTIRDGRLYGRGACDTKGSLAAMLVAIGRLQNRRDELAVNVTLLATVDEEHSATGIKAFCNSDAPASAAVIGEPTSLRLVVAHKGCVRGTIRVHGRAAHSAAPERGLSAIEGAADVIVRLRDLRNELADRRHLLVSGPTLTIGLIDGGSGVNIVPATCSITYDRRVIPGEEPAAVLSEIDAVLEDIRQECPELGIVREEPYLIDEALDTNQAEPFVTSARSACVATDLSDVPIGVSYGTDASKLQARRGIPAIVFGPGSINQAHGADEFVTINELERAATFYEQLALHYPSQGDKRYEDSRSHLPH